MWRPVLLLFLVLAGCSDRGGPPAAAYRNPVDRFRVALGLDGLFGGVCFRREDIGLVYVGDADCYRFGPPRRMRGVWRAAFEGSEFFPGRTTPPGEDETSGVWLSVDENAPLPIAVRRKGGWEHPPLLLVDFVGRQTLFPGGYGHMGMSHDLIVVDRLLSARVLVLPQP